MELGAQAEGLSVCVLRLVLETGREVWAGPETAFQASSQGLLTPQCESVAFTENQ